MFTVMEPQELVFKPPDSRNDLQASVKLALSLLAQPVYFYFLYLTLMAW